MGFVGFLPIVLVIMVVMMMLFLFIAVCISIGIGGVSVSLFIKDKIVKRILIIIFLIVFCVGLICFCPFAVYIAGLPASFTSWSTGLLGVCIGFLTLRGVKFSKAVQIKIVRILLTVLFYFVLFIEISLTIFIMIVSLMFS